MYACMLVQSFEAIVIIGRLNVVMPRCWGVYSRGHQIHPVIHPGEKMSYTLTLTSDISHPTPLEITEIALLVTQPLRGN